MEVLCRELGICSKSEPGPGWSPAFRRQLYAENRLKPGLQPLSDPEAWTEVLQGLRILVIHAGGDSHRLPAYGPCGKISCRCPGTPVRQLGQHSSIGNCPRLWQYRRGKKAGSREQGRDRADRNRGGRRAPAVQSTRGPIGRRRLRTGLLRFAGRGQRTWRVLSSRQRSRTAFPAKTVSRHPGAGAGDHRLRPITAGYGRL